MGLILGLGRSPWSRIWHATPVSLLRESHGQKSVVGYSPWDCKESYTTEQTHTHSPKESILFFFFENMLFLNLLVANSFCFIIDLK